ncbi:MAG: hypothetical protein JSR97_05345 [Verrucomicrobia bacterium]|nr:hypothetical protein [Verrucomicrobiota bacterium]
MKVIKILSIAMLFISCEHKMNLETGTSEIKAFLKNQYGNIFQVDSICKDFSQDLFKQQMGFKVWLKDSQSIRFGPIFFEKNKYQGGWITYGGTDIINEYEKAKSK